MLYESETIESVQQTRLSGRDGPLSSSALGKRLAAASSAVGAYGSREFSLLLEYTKLESASSQCTPHPRPGVIVRQKNNFEERKLFAEANLIVAVKRLIF